MSHKINPFKARSSKRNFQKQERALRATCLLCQILWSIVVQYRHLPADSSLNWAFGVSTEPRAVTVRTRMKFPE